MLPGYLTQPWMHAKLTLVVLVLGYHHACGAMLKKFEKGENQRSHVWLRWFNEVPVILLLDGEAFMATTNLHYRATQDKSGAAK